jgi:hypothetical protein
MTTYAYTAKAALFDRLQARTAPAQPLEGLQVEYAYPGSNVEAECVYGGGVRFEQRDSVAEQPGVLVTEEVLVAVYIRVVARPPGPVEDTDIRAAEIGDAVGTLLRTEPTLAGGGFVIGIARGQGDYHRTDDETVSILTYQVRMAGFLNYGTS